MKKSRWRCRNPLAGAISAMAWLSVGFLPTCSSSGSSRQTKAPPLDGGADGDDVAHDGAAAGEDAGADAIARLPTFTAVYHQVLIPNCALPFCHAGTGDYLELADMEIGYASLVNAPAEGPACAETGLKRVDPGHPETSLLVLKVTTPPCGDKMPRSYGSAMSLDPLAIEQIEAWITLGAKND